MITIQDTPRCSRRLLITGTDTNVGKTHVTCLIAKQMIARGFNVVAYKPVCSGAMAPTQPGSENGKSGAYQWDDLERIKLAVGGDWSDEQLCPQRFIAPLAPPVAARLEGRTVDFGKMLEGIGQFDEFDLLLIEGAGGWLSPVTDTRLFADFAEVIHAPILIVARAGLGTINHTLMTINSIQSRGLPIAGVILNQVVSGSVDPSVSTNAMEIEANSGVPVLGTIPYGNDLEIHQCGVPVHINWMLLAESVSPARRNDKTSSVIKPRTASDKEISSGQQQIVVEQDAARMKSSQKVADDQPPNSNSFVFKGSQVLSETPTGTSEAEFASYNRLETTQDSWDNFSSNLARTETTIPFGTDKATTTIRRRSNSLSITTLIILGSYASLLTIYLVYLIFVDQRHQLESLPDLKTVEQRGGRAIVPRPENKLPGGHQLKLGQSQRYGDVRVTPLRVTRGPLQFTHRTKGTNHKRSISSPVLKLWLLFENVSSGQSIVPIDETLTMFRKNLDDRIVAYNIIFESFSGSKSAPAVKYFLFDRLHADSDWKINGQKLGTLLAPGDSLETFVPSVENIEDLPGDYIWRVHFRKGYGRETGNGVTTLVDICFHGRDVMMDSQTPNKEN